MKLRFLAIAFAVTFLMVGAQAQVIYSQLPNFNGADSSQNDTSGGFGNFATVYDNFTLNTTSNVTGVGFWGSYFNPPQQGPITGFTVNFYSGCTLDINSCNLLQTNHFDGAAGETFVQTDNAGDPTYSYGVTLGAAFVAQAGQEYWLSIVPDLAFPPQWGWEFSSTGDGHGLQDFFGARTDTLTDFAFTLSSAQTGTPEPGTLVMLGTGILGLAGTLRRKLF